MKHGDGQAREGDKHNPALLTSVRPPSSTGGGEFEWKPTATFWTPDHPSDVVVSHLSFALTALETKKMKTDQQAMGPLVAKVQPLPALV